MKYYWAKLYKNKKLRLICLLLIFIFFLSHEIKPFFLSYFAYKESDPAPFILTKIIEPPAEPEEVIFPIEISTVPFEQLKFFATNDYNFPVFEKDGAKYEILYQDKQITHMQLSPDKRKIGFYIHISQDEMLLNKTSLVIMDIEKRRFKDISEGDLRVSNWEWKNNNQFIIYINCGTGCHLAHIRSVNDGKLITEYLDMRT